MVLYNRRLMRSRIDSLLLPTLAGPAQQNDISKTQMRRRDFPNE